MLGCNLTKIHNEALGKIMKLSSAFWTRHTKKSIIENFKQEAVDIDINIEYPPRALHRETLKLNKINYFSDHLPIFKEVHDNMLIISWNIGVGENKN